MKRYDASVVHARGQTAFFASKARVFFRKRKGEKGSQSPSVDCCVIL